VSVFGKNSESGAYVFFAVESGHLSFDLVKNVVNSQMYVAEFALQGYPLGEEDLLSSGQDAWDAALNTVNVGKFNLGWASIGICTHAFYEALGHAARRRLYGQAVTDFPHVRGLLGEAWARLVAMRLFATRASDYMRSASLQDRRYLLYNPLVKMKVTTEGEAVINRLWDVIAARGFEKDTYFEMAARDIRALPKLEGTVHVNMALVVKFMANYLFNPGSFPEIPRRIDPVDDTFLFNQGPTRGLGQVRFHDWTAAYGLFDTPNLQCFRGQIDAFKALLVQAPPDQAQAREIDFLLTAGELFTLVAYGQLILEQAHLDRLPAAVVDGIFQVLVQDFARQALELSAKPTATATQSDLCRHMIARPVWDPRASDGIWRERVFPLVDAYAMNP
jgi:acyl-CoA dehydrogenase